MNRCNKSFVPVVKEELSSSACEPSGSFENVAPIIISWPADMAPNRRSYSHDSNTTCVSRPIIPVIPLKSRNNSLLTVGQAQQFSSTTFVNGAMKVEATTKYETPDQTYVNSQYLHNQTTLEVPIETLVCADNEIQTIHVGNVTNLPSADVVGPSPKETFIATRDRSGTYYVTVQKSNLDSDTNENGITNTKPLIPDPIIKPMPSTRGSFYSKRGIIMYGKSRMIADVHTTISVREFKTQLNDTSDTISCMEIAPPTKVYMKALNTRGVNKLFANPGRHISASLSKCYTRHLTMKQIEGQQTFSDLELPPLVFTAKDDQSDKKRIPQKRSCPDGNESPKPVSKHLAPTAELVKKVDQRMKKQIPRKRSRPEDEDSLKPVGEHLALADEPLEDLNPSNDNLIIVEDSSTDSCEGENEEVDGPIGVEDSPVDFKDQDIQEHGYHHKTDEASQKDSDPDAKGQQKPLRKYISPKTGRVQRFDKG